MNTFYYNMVWIIFSLIGIGITISIALLLLHLRRSASVEKDLSAIMQRVNHMDNLFKDHFKVVDQTILDARKERDYWKDKVVALEKKS